MKKKIAVFASGEGSNAQRIMDHFRDSDLAAVALVVSNKPEAKVLQRARAAGIPTLLISRTSFYESGETVDALRAAGIDLVVLAGFLWMVPENLVKAFPDRIINIHPALLPKFGGKGMYGMHVHKAVIGAGEKESGISIHFVNEKYDDGAIISQHRCEVTETDTAETLAEKIHALEHAVFPGVVEEVIRSLVERTNKTAN